MSYEKVYSMSINEKQSKISLSTCSNNVYPQKPERLIKVYTKNTFKDEMWGWLDAMLGGSIQFSSANSYKWWYRLESVTKYIEGTDEFKNYTCDDEDFKLWKFIDHAPDNIKSKAVDIFLHGSNEEPKNANKKEWYSVLNNYVVYKLTARQAKLDNIDYVKPYNFYKANFFAQDIFVNDKAKVISASEINR